jgi:glutamate synthase (NADPH/NADH) small chain
MVNRSKVTGFLEIDRQDGEVSAGGRPDRHFNEFTIPMSEGSEEAGRALHGLRHPLLPRPTGCPITTRSPTGTIWSTTGNWEERSATCTRPTTSRSSPAASARPVRGSLHAEPRGQPVAIKTVEQAIADKAWKRAGSCRSRDKQRPARRSPSSVPAPPAWLLPSSSAALVTMCMSMSASPPRRPAALRHSRLQDGKALHRPPRRADGSRRRDVPSATSMSVSTRAARAARTYDAVLLAGGSEKPRDVGIPGLTWIGVHYAMPYPGAAEQAGERESIDNVGWPSIRSLPGASMWW